MLTTSVFRGVIGSFASGWLGDKIGKKLMITIAYVLILVGISVEMVATTNPVFFGAKFTIGFAIGTGLTVSFSYVGEIAPPRLRGIIGAAGSISFIVAQLIVAIIQKGVSDREDRWAYRGIFVAQYGITFIGIVFLPFMPEYVIPDLKQQQLTRTGPHIGLLAVVTMPKQQSLSAALGTRQYKSLSASLI